MVTHFFTLFALTKELDKALHNSQIHEIFTQQKDGLYITVSTDEKEYTLSVSVDPAANHLLLRDAVSRARKNSVDLFAPVSGSRIDHIAMLDFDRTVTITFIGAPYRLLIQLYNTVKSNIFLLDGGGTIVEAFKQGKEFEGTAFPQHQQRLERRAAPRIRAAAGTRLARRALTALALGR